MREEAIRLCWELGDPRGVARTLHYIGEESRDTGDRAGARRAFEESLDVMRELGDKSFVMASLHGLGDLELDSENLPAASERYRESLALALELDTPNVVLLTLAGLASRRGGVRRPDPGRTPLGGRGEHGAAARPADSSLRA